MLRLRELRLRLCIPCGGQRGGLPRLTGGRQPDRLEAAAISRRRRYRALLCFNRAAVALAWRNRALLRKPVSARVDQFYASVRYYRGNVLHASRRAHRLRPLTRVTGVARIKRASYVIC